MSFTRDEQGARQALGLAAGVLAGDERSLDQMRRLGMTERQQFLNHLWAIYSTVQYDSRAVAWDGSEAMDRVQREIVASQMVVPPGFYAMADSTPFQLRRPLAPYNLFRLVVSRFSGLLFSEKRHPRIICPGDAEKQEFVNGLVEASRLWAVMAEARNFGGACGSVGVCFGFVDGTPTVEVLDPRWTFPKFKSRAKLEVEKVEVRYIFQSEERDERGRWQKVDMWYRRVINDKVDAVWDGVRVDPDEEPNWAAIDHTETHHGFGFCPAVWIQNTRVQDDVDGEYDCLGTLDLMVQLDRLLSRALSGIDANCDPTTVLENVGQLELNELRKGSGNAIKLPQGQAKYLEISGTGPKTALEAALHLRGWILEVCQCVLEDPDVAAAQKTATEVIRRFASMHERADKMREQYGQRGFLPLLEMMVKAARVLSNGYVDTGAGLVRRTIKLPPKVTTNADGSTTITQRTLPAAESGCMLSVVWPPWLDPSPADAQAAVTAAGSALAQGMIDLDHAVRYIAPYFSVENVQALIDKLIQEKKAAERNMQDSLMAGMGFGPGGPAQPPPGNEGEVLAPEGGSAPPVPGAV